MQTHKHSGFLASGRLGVCVLVALALAGLSASLGAGGATAATATTLTITSISPSTTVTGQSYTVNWSISPTSGPTGTVHVKVDGTERCSASVGTGSCTVSISAATNVGTHAVIAHYDGDSNYAADDSNTVNHTVNKANTTTTITNGTSLTNNSTTVGQSYNVSYSVTVNSPGVVSGGVNGSAVLTGNVTVSDGTDSHTCALSAGTCSLTSTTVGLKTITAQYLGDSNFNGSTSAGVAHTVSKGTTVTTITNATSLTNNASVVGQSVTVSGTVAPGIGSGHPSGSVTVHSSNDCTATVQSNGTWSCNVAWTTRGDGTAGFPLKDVYAAYSGDANYFDSTSATLQHSVTKASTTIIITNTADLDGANNSNVPHTVEWAVSVNSPGSGTPTGQVTVSVNGFSACFGLVNNNDDSGTTAVEGRCTITVGPPGAWNFTAHYSGDDNFNASDSEGFPASDTSIVIANAATLSSTPSPAGTPFVVQWTLTPASGPTGTVTVKVNNVAAADCTNVDVADGQCSITPASSGLKALVAVYSGDDNFNGSSSTAVFHTVDPKLKTTLTIDNRTELGAPSTLGTDYTIEWTVANGSDGVQMRVFGDAGTCTTVSGGSGTCTMTPSRAGFKFLLLYYPGDAATGPSFAFVLHRVVSQ